MLRACACGFYGDTDTRIGGFPVNSPGDTHEGLWHNNRYSVCSWPVKQRGIKTAYAHGRHFWTALSKQLVHFFPNLVWKV